MKEKACRLRPEHEPKGDPCSRCNEPASKHRKRHRPGRPQTYRPGHIHEGDPCAICGLDAAKHRHRLESEQCVYIGIDGEGQGRGDHRYVMLAAQTEHGDRQWVVEAPPGGRLSTIECLEMILSLPTRRAKVFSYSFNYDLTKMLTDLDDQSLYLLFRPELRQRGGDEAIKGPCPIKWRGYRLNLVGTKFTVAKDGKRVVVWDLFKFFQAKFVSALKDWKVGSPDLHVRMSGMKDKRGENEWDRTDAKTLAAMRAYCLEECQCIAELAQKLISAHNDAGLKLRNYHGAGSSGAAMLDVMGIKDALEPCPPKMHEAAASAFFGGRFENSVIGAIREPLYNYDISSAYPYHTTFLPCLKHGKWSLTTDRKRMRSAKAALISYKLGNAPKVASWGPFPFRDVDGSISFPLESGGGWIWRDEFLSGEKLFSHVKFQKAWILNSSCSCQPFAQLPSYYVVRLQLGKEGPGIVIKLAVNSCYGKLAQSLGNPKFNSWIWAGMITSGCRAQILDMLGLHTDWSNLLMIATDGIYTREKLEPPTPRDTGTNVEIGGKRKPLGGWEEAYHPNGMFVARPGIYFPISPSQEEIKKIRARGVGRSVVLEHWQSIVDAWERDGVSAIARVPNVSRFCGGKTSTFKAKGSYGRALRGRSKKDGGILPAYGEWVSRMVEMSFDPMPKRSGVHADGLTLVLRKFPRNARSVPYGKAMLSKEAETLKTEFQILMEQPDVDYFPEHYG